MPSKPVGQTSTSARGLQAPPSKQSTAPLVEVLTRSEWRAWLAANHDTCTGAWLVTFKKSSGRKRVTYDDAVEEALCFGWIDSTAGKVDDLRAKLWFCPRKPKSGWSKLNKDRVERLIAEGLMTPAGQAVIDTAKHNGAWSALDEVEALIIPADLAADLAANPTAQAYFDAFPKSARKGILDLLRSAKRPETRAKRIAEIVRLAAENRRYGFDRK